MQYRKMPNSEDKLSAIGYGCMRLPTRMGGVASSMIDKDKAIKQIRGAIDKGVNYLDTAWPYHLGASETFLGEHILKDGYREKVKIATKLPCMMIRRKEQIREIFNKQLEKLQVDYIDYYLLHSMNGSSWEKMKSLGIFEFMDEIRKTGKVRHMGFSFHGKKEDFIKICDEYNFDFAQVQYNILDENFQAGIEGIEYAYKKGMGIIVMEPLRGGSLVGKIPAEVEKIYDVAPIKRTPADWALRWIWNHPAVTVILSGMNIDEHIAENIKIASEALPNSLTKQELDIISRVKNKYHELLAIGCTGCAYCMPCPAGIDIPSSFKSLNNFHMFGKLEARLFHTVYSGFHTKDKKPHWSSSCIDCGKCEKACPQDLEIRKALKQVGKDLEGPFLKGVSSVARFFTR